VAALLTAAGAQEKGPIVLVSGDLSDPFFGAIKRGADDAAKNLGVKYTYLASNISGPDLAKALEAATATNPAGVAFGDWFPDAQDPIVKALAEQGVPVVGYNSGPDKWQESTGAIAWVKQSDFDAGRRAAQLFAEQRSKHALCVNHGPGAALFEQRCDGLEAGMKEAGGTSTDLSIPYQDVTNPGKVMQAVQGALNGNKDIDAVFTLGSGTARDALRVVTEMTGDKKPVVGTVDLSTEVLQQVKDGNLLFAIDQQPYLQGYYAIAILAQEIKFGLHPVGTVSTGPLAITKDTAARAIEVNGTEQGIRGAL
jgi:simple sugar transport system substrate-binding protein